MAENPPEDGEATPGRLAELEEEVTRLRNRLTAAEAEAEGKAGAAGASEDRLRTILAGATDYAIIAMDREGRITLWNPGARALFGHEEAEALGQPAAILFTPEDRAAGVPAAERVQAAATGRADSERWHLRKDGSRFYGLQLVAPLRDGEPEGFLKVVRDRTEERRVEAERRRSEERLRLILESATEYAILTIDRNRRVTSWNTGAQRLLGYDEAEILGQDADVIFTPEDREKGEPERELATALREGRATNERWHLRKDGTRLWGSGLMMLLRDPEDGFLKILRDRTEQRRADEMQRLLIGELNHRVKNILMTVQSLVGQTLRSTESKEAFAAAINSRLSGMARAHDLLTNTAWKGADIVDAARAALAPWIADNRVSLSGPSVHLPPRYILAVSMALHELATNALKYGALSVPEGRVTLAWQYGSAFEAEWRESGGPPVTPPTRQGFGSRILNRALAAELGGTVDLRFEPTGVACCIRFEPDTELLPPPSGPAED